jgi:Tol biopolymer transport system component
VRDYCLPAPRYCSRTALDVELQLLPAAGGQPRTLVAWKGYDILDPAPSPDGRSILFVSNRSGNRDIWSVPVGGGEPVPFVANPFDDFSPQFSPDASPTGRHLRDSWPA